MFVSIPNGSIKSIELIDKKIDSEGVSIPNGSIKSKYTDSNHEHFFKFQFQMVQLKAFVPNVFR